MSSNTVATAPLSAGFDVDAHLHSVMNDLGLSPEDTSGTLGAVGIQAALIRRAKEGGSYHVRVNLARCAMWFMSLGTFDKNAQAPAGERHQLLAPDTITAQTPYGELVRLGPTRQVLRNQALLARPATRGAWVKQAAMEKQLTLRAPPTQETPRVERWLSARPVDRRQCSTPSR